MKKLILIFFVFLIGCSTHKNKSEITSCDFETIVNAQKYQNALHNQVHINNIEIIENCLLVNYSAGGCNGDSWELQLIDADQIMESNPVQRNLKFDFNNQEDCLAIVTKETSFDLTNLRVQENSVLLNIERYNQILLYEY